MSRRRNNLFKEVPVAPVRRNYFDLSHEVKATMKFGYLYPVLLLDVLPGDNVSDQMTAFVRSAPLLSPVMHRIDVSTHFFFVPNRLLSDYWEDFITGGVDGLNSTVLPYITPEGIRTAAGGAGLMQGGGLWDYFGLPTSPPGAASPFTSEQINCFPFRAYQKIYNDYYRDPTFDPEVPLNEELQGHVSTQSVDNQHLNIRRRGWERDYFTGALPWAQRGAEVLMPLAGTGSVSYLDQSIIKTDTGAGMLADALLGVSVPPSSAGVQDGLELKNDLVSPGVPARVENIDEVSIENSTVSINDFRTSLAIQRWLENNARGGPRYTEQILSHFGTRVPDFRLQRAEYLGGGKQPVQISEVLATAESEDVPVGDMMGHGISVGKSNRFSYRCQEHGWVIGIVSIMPIPAYNLGIEKMWTRPSRYDYAWPELARLGEQQILSKELYFAFPDSETSDNNSVFGYIPRYAEYKYKPDRIVGDFRTTLAFWHLARIHYGRPVLDGAFLRMQEEGIEDFEETYRRIFAVQDGTDYFWCQFFHRLSAMRPLPYFGVPQII